MLKLDAGTGTDLIQAKVEVKENFKELKRKEKELDKRLEHTKELEKHLADEKNRLQELDDQIKMKSIRAEKMFKVNIRHVYITFLELTSTDHNTKLLITNGIFKFVKIDDVHLS